MGVWSGDNANVRSSLATEVKAAPRGVAEAFGYSVLRSEQADAIEKSVMSLYLFLSNFSFPTGSGKRAYVLLMRLNLSLLTQQNQENFQLSYSSVGVGSGD